MRRDYDEDRWLWQKFYPVLIVEKDTMEPVCRRMASRWQMSFASSRGYSSLTLQHDAAQMLNDRYARTGQTAIVYFVSDLDPSGLDLQPLVGRGAGQFRRPLHPRPHRPHPRSSARQYGHPRPAARASRHQGQEQRQPRRKLHQAARRYLLGGRYPAGWRHRGGARRPHWELARP
jgi:hypothetical protein